MNCYLDGVPLDPKPSATSDPPPNLAGSDAILSCRAGAAYTRDFGPPLFRNVAAG